MELDHPTLVRAFAGQADTIRTIARGFDDFTAPTRLPDWSVRVLVGHIASAVEALWRWQAPPPGDGTAVDAVAYWTPVGAIADVNSQWAQAYAAKRTDDELRAVLNDALDHGTAVVEETDPAATVVMPASAFVIRFDDFTATRLVELVVHGLDLVAAGGPEVAPDPDALRIVGAILDARLDGDRPDDVADDVVWVEAATGRVAHPDERLPVLG